MNDKSPTTTRRSWRISLAVGVSALLLVALIVWITRPDSKQANSVDEQIKQAEQQADERKLETADRTKPRGQDQEAQISPNLSIAINRASQLGAGEPLNIRATVTGTTDGTCEVSLTKNGQPTINRSFSVAFEATTAICVSADIPMSDFAVGGEWNLSVVVKSGAKVSQPSTVQVTLEK